MPVVRLFSKQSQQPPDVFQYEMLPQAFRVQVVQILDYALGSIDPAYYPDKAAAYQLIHDTLCHEYGWLQLGEGIHEKFNKPWDAVRVFLLKSSDTEKLLDTIQVAFEVVQVWCSNYTYRIRAKSILEPADAIEELNFRFREHGIGYYYESGGSIVRVDSALAHQEIVKPALVVLSDKRFAGANAEYLSAWEHYRHRRTKECLADCLKAFESTMRIICDKQRWQYKPTAQAKDLLDVCFANHLIPEYLTTHFGGLRAALESGVPTVRNREAGHGQGAIPREVPDYLAAYLLQLTAAAVLLLTNAEKEI